MESKETYSNILLLGDSMFADENFRKHFRKFFKDEHVGVTISNCSVSGTTVGPYSLYPTDNNCLINRVMDPAVERRLAQCDIVVLEMGLNDAASVIAENCTLRNVQISIIKTIDHIHQVNPNCQIVYANLGSHNSTWMHAKFIEVYLKEYLKTLPLCEDLIDAQKWFLAYIQIGFQFNKLCDIMVDMFQFKDESMFEKYMQEGDGVHPSAAGFEAVAKNIGAQLLNCIHK